MRPLAYEEGWFLSVFRMAESVISLFVGNFEYLKAIFKQLLTHLKVLILASTFLLREE